MLTELTCDCVKLIFIWLHDRNVAVCLLMLKVLHSRWNLVLWVDGVCYSEQFVEGTAQQVDSAIVG